MAGIESTGVTTHRHQTTGLLQLDHRITVAQDIAQRDFDLHMFARFEAIHGLAGVHLGGRTQDDRVKFLDLERFGQIGAHMTNAVLGSHLTRFIQFTTDQ